MSGMSGMSGRSGISGISIISGEIHWGGGGAIALGAGVGGVAG
jgi:hypothetical protein